MPVLGSRVKSAEHCQRATMRVLLALWGPHMVCPGDIVIPFYGIYIHKPCESHPARMEAPGALQNVNASPGQGQAAKRCKCDPLGCCWPCVVPMWSVLVILLIHSMPYIYTKPCESHPACMEAPGALQNMNASLDRICSLNTAKEPP